jgi:hypothetical protein
MKDRTKEIIYGLTMYMAGGITMLIMCLAYASFHLHAVCSSPEHCIIIWK